MSKSSIICNACGEENEPNAEFCISCGTTLENNRTDKELDEQERMEREYKSWKRSVPYTSSVCILLLFIDLFTGSGINWSYWAILPIFLFAILAPYLSYKLS